eukprot:1487108-Amphidinium_carterae.2
MRQNGERQCPYPRDDKTTASFELSLLLVRQVHGACLQADLRTTLKRDSDTKFISRLKLVSQAVCLKRPVQRASGCTIRRWNKVAGKGTTGIWPPGAGFLPDFSRNLVSEPIQPLF